MIDRREFILGASVAAAAMPIAASAQQTTMPVIGFLHPAAADTSMDRLEAFRKGLGEAGFAEGRNVGIEFRWADDRTARLPAMAADLVGRQVAVIFATGIPAVMAAKAATATIPIVFNLGADPVALGVVTSFNRPSGNVTGIGTLGAEVGPKRLELLHELVPSATRVAFLVNPANPESTRIQSGEMQAAAGALGVGVHIIQVRGESEFESTFADLAQLRVGALAIANDGLFISRRAELGALAARYSIPAIFQYREFAAAGGLMSYGSDSGEIYRQSGIYVGRILKGEKPADLPVQRATKVELIINLKTAKALGIKFPLTLLGRADEVIE